MPKTEYNFFPAENKWDVDQHRYEGAENAPLGKHIGSLTLHAPGPDNPSGGEIAIDLNPNGKSEDYIKKTVQGLLAHAGFENARFDNAYNGGSFRLSLDGMTTGDLLKVAAALATNAPDGKHDTHFALLDKTVAGEILQSELQRLNLSPAAAGLLQLKTEALTPERQRALGLEKPFAYTDADLSAYPLSPVTVLQEDGTPASLFVKNTLYVETRLDLNDVNPQGVRAALKAANIPFKENGNSHTLKAAAPIDAVAEALGRGGVLPRAFTDEIAAAAEKGHQNQRQINSDIAAAETAPPQRPQKPAAGMKL